MTITIDDTSITGSSGAVDFGSSNITTSGTIPAASLTGAIPAISGASMTGLNATQLASGTVPDARLPANVPNVAPGTSGNLLTSTGSAWASSAAAAGGAWAVTSSGTFSTTANLTVTGLTKTTSVILENVVLSSDAGYMLNVKFSTDNGSTMVTTATYDSAVQAASVIINADRLYMNVGGQGANTDEAFGCWFTVYKPNTAGGTYASWLYSGVNTSNAVNGSAGGGNLRGNHAVNAMQFVVVGGGVTLLSGSYTVLELN
jgi:hypothetical protein